MMKRDEVEDALDVVRGTFSIHSYPVNVLFDYRASHSFIAPGIVDKLKLVPSLGSPAMSITMPSEDTRTCKKLFIGCPMLIVGQEFKLTCITLT